MSQDPVPVPLYRDAKFLITMTALLIVAGLEVWAFIDDKVFATLLEYILSGYFGVAPHG